MLLGSLVVGLGASLGIALAAPPDQASGHVTRQAGGAMYRARADGGGAACRFDAPGRRRTDWPERPSA